jgi:hypothetical protein
MSISNSSSNKVVIPLFLAKHKNLSSNSLVKLVAIFGKLPSGSLARAYMRARSRLAIARKVAPALLSRARESCPPRFPSLARAKKRNPEVAPPFPSSIPLPREPRSPEVAPRRAVPLSLFDAKPAGGVQPSSTWPVLFSIFDAED